MVAVRTLDWEDVQTMEKGTTQEIPLDVKIKTYFD
jgi:hypothetical protein